MVVGTYREFDNDFPHSTAVLTMGNFGINACSMANRVNACPSTLGGIHHAVELVQPGAHSIDRLVAEPDDPGAPRDHWGVNVKASLKGDGQMPELLVDFITSLDGYGAAEGWPGWWGLEGPEYLTWLEDQPEAGYVVLMGARTYRVMAGLAAEGEPGTEALAQLEKLVFSNSLTEPLAWPNTRLIREDPVEAVRQMKETGPRSMRTMGSLMLCRSLLEAGLVDRFRVVLFPVITGRTGRERIYDGYPDVSLEMVNSRTFDGRLQLLEYVPSVSDVPPPQAEHDFP